MLLLLVSDDGVGGGRDARCSRMVRKTGAPLVRMSAKASTMP
jgi:hypothetical protein